MNISDIRIKLVADSDNLLKGIASFTIDDSFVVHDVKIIESEKGAFVSMPSRLAPNGKRRDIVHPANSETRTQLTSAILTAYEQAKSAPQE